MKWDMASICSSLESELALLHSNDAPKLEKFALF